MFRGVVRGKTAHVDDFAFMLQRASIVEKIIVTAGSLAEARIALELVKSHEKLYFTVGVHPTRCGEFDTHGPDLYYNELLQVIKEAGEKCVAIGELGLDYEREQFCHRDVQKKYFEKQLDLAKSTGLPLFLHNRQSTDDFVDILQRNREKWTNGVVHSWTDSQHNLQQALSLGLYIGINGCSLKTEENLKVVQQIPLDRMMLETDAPWCDLRPTHAGYSLLDPTLPWMDTKMWSKKADKHIPGPNQLVKGRNEPCMILHVLNIVSQVKQMGETEMAHQIHQNTVNVFFP